MKIYNSPMDAIKAYSAGSTNGVGNARFSSQVQGGAPVQSSDKVDISSSVKLMQDIHQAISKAPDVRMDKVKDIESSIEKGIYKADLTVVAQKLLSPNISDRI
jgi:flagellar biosynthesis anti-sigma factor FlgM